MKIKYFVMLGFVILSFSFISANSVADCGTDFDCFINASLNCSLAKVTNTSTINLFGIEITTTTYYELKGMEENNCTYYFKTDEQHINFSDEMREFMLDSNATQEEIETQLEISNEQSDLLEGKDAICKIPISDLIIFLNKTKMGDVSGGSSCDLSPSGTICTYTGDLEIYNNCEGSYFNTQLVETSSIITSITPTVTISAYPTEFRVVINSSRNISEYYWDFGDQKNKTTTTNKVVHTYNSTGQYILKIKITDSNQNEFYKNFNVTVSSPKNAINSSIEKRLNNLNRVQTQIKNFDLFYQSSLNSALNMDFLNSTLNEIQKNYTSTTSEDEYGKIMTRLLGLQIPEKITTSKVADSLSFYLSERDIDLDILTSITGEEYDFDDEDKYANSVLAWNQENIEIKISFKEISATYSDETKPAVSVFEIELTKKADSDNAYFIFYDIEGLKFKDNLLDEKFGYFYTDLSESKTIVFSTTEEISFSELPIFISPGINKLSISGYDVDEDENGEQERKWVFFILIISLLIIIGFVTYIILQEWYKRRYENYLFKNRNNLYNLLTYIDNAKKRGLKNKDILVKLKKVGWNSEQIKYVMRKYVGKRTGMFEIPLGKLFGIFKKTENGRGHGEKQI